MTIDAGTGTPAAGSEAPDAGSGTPVVHDEVTTLRSRNAGLDAKVTSLQQSIAAAEARAAAAEARATELAQNKEGGDAELRAQLVKAQEAITAAERKAALADIKAAYPETFTVLGEAAAGLTADQLAANEARLGGTGTVETPKPVGANPARQQALSPKAVEDMTIDELQAHLASFNLREVFGATDD
jgi:aminopeptidase N